MLLCKMFHRRKMALFCTLVVAWQSGTDANVRAYTKTAGREINLLGCYVASWMPPLSSEQLKFQCAMRCSLSLTCRFFCITYDTSDCYLSSAYVAKKWTSVGGIPYDACYTSWGLDRDVINALTQITSSSSGNVSPGTNGYATDGYFCSYFEYYVTEAETGGYIQFDLGREITIETVVVITDSIDHFSNIAVFLSNFSSRFFPWRQWSWYLGNLPAGVPATIKPIGGSFAGRFLSFKSQNQCCYQVGIAEVLVSESP